MITFAVLMLTVEIIWGSLPLNAATNSRMGTCMFTSVRSKIEKIADPALENFSIAQESLAKGPLFRVVRIRTTPSRGLKQLRAMHLDIVRVRPDPDRPPQGDLLSGGFIVEAVATSGQLAKLKKMGFEVYEVPEKN
jgi:hypothetical protein